LMKGFWARNAAVISLFEASAAVIPGGVILRVLLLLGLP